MSRNLIDRDALIASIPKTNVDIFENCRNCSTLCDWQVRELIEQAELVDAVEVVRCKDCRWGKEAHGSIECTVENGSNWAEYHGYEWFCPNGERKGASR